MWLQATKYVFIKPITYGIKFWCVVDATTNFVLNFVLNVGAINKRGLKLPSSDLGKDASIVICLTERFCGNWFSVVMDNYFFGLLLLEEILRRGFYCIGIVFSKWKDCPSSLVIQKKKAV